MSYRDAATVIVRHPELVGAEFIWRPTCPCQFCRELADTVEGDTVVFSVIRQEELFEPEPEPLPPEVRVVRMSRLTPS